MKKLGAYARLWAEGKSLEDRAKKWECLAAQLREEHGRAEEVQLTTELDRMWSSRPGSRNDASVSGERGEMSMGEGSEGDGDGDEGEEGDEDIGFG